MAKFFVLLVAFAIIAQVSMTFLPRHECGCGSRIKFGSVRGLANHGGLLNHGSLLSLGSLVGHEEPVVEKRISLQPIHEIERVHAPIYQNPTPSKVIGYWPINNKSYNCGDRHRVIISPPARSC